MTQTTPPDLSKLRIDRGLAPVVSRRRRRWLWWGGILMVLAVAGGWFALQPRVTTVQTTTVAWLTRYELRWDLLIMRDFGDYDASRDFKQRTVWELRQFGFDLRLAFEDDRRNYDMFHAEGIPCVYIHSGYYE